MDHGQYEESHKGNPLRPLELDPFTPVLTSFGHSLTYGKHIPEAEQVFRKTSI